MARVIPPRALAAAFLAAVVLHVGAAAAQQETPEPEGQGEQEGGVRVHVVQRGETLFSIAQTYGTSVDSVQLANNIPDPTLIEVGQRLIIPGADGVPLALASVTVGPADSLATLAFQHATTPARLAILNGVTHPDLLFVGQRLDVDGILAGAPDTANATAHVVQPGESASRVAAAGRPALSLVEMLRANGLVSPAQIYPGQTLLLPGGEVPATALSAPWQAVTIHPLPVEQGQTFSLTVRTSSPGVVTGSLLSRDLQFWSDGTTHVALSGIHAFTRPGVYQLALSFAADDGNTYAFSRQLMVAEGGYTSETINVPGGLEGLLDEALLDSEYALVSDMMSGYTEGRYWDGLFLLPTGGDVASAFGTRREYEQGEVLLAGRFHSGADFAMPLATPILAPAPGVVVFAGQLEVRGNTTVIHHGWGVYTGYWHQSGIQVQAGDVVQAGQQIGTVGSTGLVTGAHLHWELWVSGVQVDPLQWVREVMP